MHLKMLIKECKSGIKAGKEREQGGGVANDTAERAINCDNTKKSLRSRNKRTLFNGQNKNGSHFKMN